MKIHIITEEKHPNLSASSIRLSLLIKSFNHAHFDTQINIIGHFQKGKLIEILKKVYLSLSISFRVKKGDIAFFYGAYSLPWTIILLKIRGIKVIFERTEFPHFMILSQTKTLTYLKEASSIISMRFSDAFITCTETLANYYSGKTKTNKNLIIPFLIQPELFNTDNIQKQKQIGYCGYMGNNKDGIFCLIDAFAKTSILYPEWTLKLMGGAEEDVITKIKQKIKQFNLQDKIILTGNIDHPTVIKNLKESSILALARPNTKQAQGGFPSKLGEYLATGTPVVVTPAGEIPKYLSDGLNAYIAKDFEPEAFSEKLIEIIQNYDKAKLIGIEGKKIALEFSYISVSSKIENFINNA